MVVYIWWGAERILANIVNNLDPDKYDIEILEYLHSDKHIEPINSNVKLLKPIIDETRKDVFSKLKKRIINEYAIMHCPSVVRKLFLNRFYDIEVSFNYMIPTFLLDRRSSLLISWIHGSIENLKCDDESRNIQRAYLGKTNEIVTISKKTQDSVIDVYPEFQSKTIKIYNGYNFEEMFHLENDYKVDQFDLLYCNRLDDNKNPIFF